MTLPVTPRHTIAAEANRKHIKAISKCAMSPDFSFVVFDALIDTVNTCKTSNFCHFSQFFPKEGSSDEQKFDLGFASFKPDNCGKAPLIFPKFRELDYSCKKLEFLSIFIISKDLLMLAKSMVCFYLLKTNFFVCFHFTLYKCVFLVPPQNSPTQKKQAQNTKVPKYPTPKYLILKQQYQLNN